MVEPLNQTEIDEKLLNQLDDLRPGKILILGGLGFIGKAFTEYLISLDRFSEIIVADKLIPQIAYIPKKSSTLYESYPLLKFRQLDLSKEKSMRSLFETFGPIQYVVNLAAETRKDMAEADYKSRNFSLTQLAAKVSEEHEVKLFIHVSTAQVYKSGGNTASKETDPTDPSYSQAVGYKLDAEKFLQTMKTLNYIILRPALVYGLGDVNNVSQRLAAGAVYSRLKEQLKIMWDDSLMWNTIHVKDVCRGILYVLVRGKLGQVYNLVDDNNTDLGKINQIVATFFNIKVLCVGKLRSHFLKLTLDSVLEYMNGLHLKSWLDICSRNKINSPINVIAYKEDVAQYSLWVDGNKIKNETKFVLAVPKMKLEIIEELIYEMMEEGWFPKMKLSWAKDSL